MDWLVGESIRNAMQDVAENILATPTFTNHARSARKVSISERLQLLQASLYQR